MLFPVSAEHPGSRELAFCPPRAAAPPQCPAVLGAFGHPVPRARFRHGTGRMVTRAPVSDRALKVESLPPLSAPSDLAFSAAAEVRVEGEGGLGKCRGGQWLRAREQCFVVTFGFDWLPDMRSTNLYFHCPQSFISSLLTAFLAALGTPDLAATASFFSASALGLLPCCPVHIPPPPT